LLPAAHKLIFAALYVIDIHRSMGGYDDGHKFSV
jgi:hypothetical protein